MKTRNQLKTIDENGHVIRPNKNRYILLGITILFLVWVTFMKLHKEKVVYVEKIGKTIEYDTVYVNVTVYHCTENECDSDPLVTASGYKINPLKPERIVGGSRDIVKLVGYGNNVNLIIPQAPYLNGEYRLEDTDNGKLTKHIDILISNPIVCSVGGSWRGYILIKK